ncbi:MAG: tRNA 4-thiouridine(8) synthase ThiI [SAR86 cluster bacterium]|uniref:Probable tRNA sulfurtransferase n=1 Tax=SAR86 cluster bacterium TaxID=2030880 RepID=A0A2A5CIX0_9GAMM|nr:tRNA 4-thiouridine(8) synthase ThiI [Gammaproteobacteria bacterium AH-315-E17]PCJ43732.1 MAG: tRNA 4-thiouridine(8) synthase ThiI [SAR86 cluster bacterium]
MKYLLKYSPEITIKSRPVRSRFVKQLSRNLTALLKKVDEKISVVSKRDYLEVNTPQDSEESCRLVEAILTSTPGVASVASTFHMSLDSLENVLSHALNLFTERLRGKTFAVRCKRAGKHSFTSMDVERVIGAGLNQQTEAAGVNLTKPDVTVRLEIREQDVFIVDELMKGLGGFPLGTQDGVLSLISGGFDSAVSSYLSIRRGLLTHYCFFNLGGHEHEIAVKEVALYLWMRYGASHRVKFISVPFEAVVSEIISKVDNSQMGVVLKRMMLRVASRLAADLNIDALVTGEAVAQVSSQTLTNLAVIDGVSETLVLRPLIMSEKQDIIDLAKKIGTEEFSAVIPEYCGVISVRPTTKARLHRIEREEERFDFSILEAAITETISSRIDQLLDSEKKASIELLEVESVPEQAIVIDIRHPDEEERSPLILPASEIKKIPFFKLNTAFESTSLEKDAQYLLYCDKGMMSRLHASYLVDKGFLNVGVYRPG